MESVTSSVDQTPSSKTTDVSAYLAIYYYQTGVSKITVNQTLHLLTVNVSVYLPMASSEVTVSHVQPIASEIQMEFVSVTVDLLSIFQLSSVSLKHQLAQEVEFGMALLVYVQVAESLIPSRIHVPFAILLTE